ncbi:DUF1206 domain-containing protein [Ohtaekwangia koreensis]|uniref:DUF1206 domain-containing protein n=1 Tax=Ohtaekwangia koreensis TaxID=688867 RepID=A0A1T5M8I1_9BACT|nr:DUF1206 domain-containing protein [Ohtaekwangia koreensis]SKC84314.1 protein of unknown function [Ohtaekwangia koreensis]
MTITKRKKSFIHYFPVYGCISTALIYAAVGVIALLSFFKVRDGGADESSMLALVNDYLVGKIFIYVILTGTLCYVIWRFYEAFTDPYRYGSHASGIAKRIGVCLSTLADIMIAYTAIRVLFHAGNIMLNGEPREEQQRVASILQEPWGNEIIILFGFLIIVTAITQFLYGVTKGYKERIDIDHYSKAFKIFTTIMAWSGFIARGVIIGIIGFFMIKSGITENAKLVVNTDKAFDFIGDHVGHIYFIIVAFGTICYGVFMFILGVAYDTDRD